MKDWKIFSSFIQILLLLSIQIRNITGKNLTSRIFGGTDIDISQAKFAVQIISKTQPNTYGMCGGSLVTPIHVITAAHCVDSARVSDITVIGGATYFGIGGVHGKVRQKYLPENQSWDIAVLTLQTALSGPNIDTIELCNTNWQTGDLLNVYGWGQTSEDEVYNEYSKLKLKEIQLPVVDYKECALYFNPIEIPDFYFCAGVNNNTGAFLGDSGGPAVFHNQLCGVVSAGANSPGISLYVDINYVKSFINRYIEYPNSQSE